MLVQIPSPPRSARIVLSFSPPCRVLISKEIVFGSLLASMENLKPLLPPIIAIDDSADDLFFLKRLVEKTGAKFPLLTFQHTADAVSYLTEAAQAAESGRLPCIIFTDLRMPLMNGLEFLAWIRGERQLNRLPVIMLSTSDDPEDIAKAKELGVDRYYIKFPTKEEVARTLDEACFPAPLTDGRRQSQ